MLTFLIASAILGIYTYRDYFFGARDNKPNSKFLAVSDPDQYTLPTKTLRQRGNATKFASVHPDIHRIDPDFSMWKDPKIQDNYKFARDSTKLLEENEWLDPVKQPNTMGVKRNPYMSINLRGAVPSD